MECLPPHTNNQNISPLAMIIMNNGIHMMDLDVILSDLQKNVFRSKERATYTTQQTELVLMWLQSFNYHIQCLEYLELNSFLFHEEFFFFQMHVECMLFVECTSKNYNDSLRHSWNRCVRIQYSPDINIGTYYFSVFIKN